MKHLETRNGFNMKPLTEWSNRFPTLRFAGGGRKRRGDLGRGSACFGGEWGQKPRGRRRRADDAAAVGGVARGRKRAGEIRQPLAAAVLWRSVEQCTAGTGLTGGGVRE